MAPFDASFIHDEALNVPVARALPTAQSATQASLEAEFGRFSLSSDATFQMPISYAELEEVLTAPAMRTTSYTEYLLQRLDRNGTLTSIVFIGALVALMMHSA
jgi:hypothetical protein